jgi:hypothetical protein
MYGLLFLYFLIGFVADIILNYLSRQSFAPASVRALKVYFKRPGIKYVNFVSAVNAGLTIVAALVLTMIISKLIFQFSHPQSLPELNRFLVLAFPIGYMMDIFIYKTEWFGSTLNPFYEIAGAGFWGAMAYLFAIIVAYPISTQR